MAKPKRRRKRTSIELKKAILSFLEEAELWCTTGEVAKATGLNWYVAVTHLSRLREEGVVFHGKVGRQQEWCLMEKYEHGFKKR
ncbi:MAG: hypothetical protein KAW41_05345 [Candidatus Diapherotrites archaeon]|nr:hypothetical protein [Candidatus Diapherotrites archaeon]